MFLKTWLFNLKIKFTFYTLPRIANLFSQIYLSPESVSNPDQLFHCLLMSHCTSSVTCSVGLSYEFKGIINGCTNCSWSWITHFSQFWNYEILFRFFTYNYIWHHQCGPMMIIFLSNTCWLFNKLMNSEFVLIFLNKSFTFRKFPHIVIYFN